MNSNLVATNYKRKLMPAAFFPLEDRYLCRKQCGCDRSARRFGQRPSLAPILGISYTNRSTTVVENTDNHFQLALKAADQKIEAIDSEHHTLQSKLSSRP